MTYAQNNAGFITSHKLQDFIRCPFCYNCKYNLLMEDPTQKDEDYFVIGQAIDDLITYGEDKYKEKYEVVARRNSKAENIQLNNTQDELIRQLYRGFNRNKFFKKENIQKKIISVELFGLNIRGELDDYDAENQMIYDIKTTANLITFDPLLYQFQMAFYHLLLDESEGIKAKARLEVVDKQTPVHHCCYEFSLQTLQEAKKMILNKLIELKECYQTDMWVSAKDREVFNCPYYGHEGHGEQQDLIVL